jgi:hydroxypyruvate isomerase
MPRFAANLSMMFTEHDFLDRFQAAANCGFQGVEFMFPYDWPMGELAKRLLGNGLTQALFNMPPGDLQAGERGLAAVPGKEQAFRDGVERALDYAETLRCQQIHIMAGMLPNESHRPMAHASFVQNLAWAAERAGERGVRALIEPINTRHDMPGYFLSTMAQARAVIAEVDSDNLFLQCDLYHVQIMNGNLADTITENLPYIRHFQIAGVPGRHEPDSGEINYPFLFSLIDSLGYDGWIGCEYRPAGATADGLAWAFDYGISGTGGG